MALETKIEAPVAAASAAEAAATQVAVPEAEKPVTAEKQVSPPEAEKPVIVVAAEKLVAQAVDAGKKITQAVSFKEETNVVGDLPELQRKALDEFKKLISEACAKREFSAPPPAPVKEEDVKVEEAAENAEEEKPASVEEVSPPPATSTATATDVAVAAEVPTTKPVVEEASKKVEEAPKPIVPSPKPEEATKPVVPSPKPEEAPKPVVPSPKPEEATKPVVEVKKEVEEKTVEAIKETIVEVAPTTTTDPPAEESAVVEEPPLDPEEISLWGIPLLADERTDTILLKFLRARDFKVKEAFTMLKNTILWRKSFGVDETLDENLGDEYAKVLFTHGVDKEGRIVCYNVFGEFQDKEFYQNTFSNGEKREKFFKWLVQFIEKIIRDLDYGEKGINSIVLVNDLKNFPGFAKRDVSKIIDKFLTLIQDNYPEFVAKQVCINTSWWYVAYYWVYLTVFTPRTKSKFVFASPSKTPETLFKYIAPEHVPIQYGGHSKIGENEFSTADSITEVTVKAYSKHPIEFEFTEAKELVWELRVIGWDVTYGAEFIPTKEGSYTLNISKPKKVAPSTDAPVLSDTFKVTETGKVVITIDNQSSKKKKLLYRTKIKSST